MTDPAQQKKALRAEWKARRLVLSDSQPDAGNKLVEVFDSALGATPPCLISAYIAQGGEIDPLPLFAPLIARGFRFCLPCVVQKEAPLLFRPYAPDDPLRLGVWRIPEPLENQPPVEPDILLVPLLAFDRAGYRLGHGAGFYDRTIAQLRARRKILAVGLAFAGQEAEALPHAPHDEKLDLILTPQGAIRTL